jgi:hypothetical protein
MDSLDFPYKNGYLLVGIPHFHPFSDKPKYDIKLSIYL